MARLTYHDLLLLRDGLDAMLADKSGDHEIDPRIGIRPNRKSGSDAPSNRRYQGEQLLPTARQVRTLIRQRKLRGDYFDGGMFLDPIWDMLLDLTLAEIEDRRVSVSSLCIASGVPQVTALRRINTLVEAGLVERQPDPLDKRRVFVSLTKPALSAVAKYFEAIEPGSRLAA